MGKERTSKKSREIFIKWRENMSNNKASLTNEIAVKDGKRTKIFLSLFTKCKIVNFYCVREELQFICRI